jgi:hypothetical protein
MRYRHNEDFVIPDRVDQAERETARPTSAMFREGIRQLFGSN